MGDETKRDESRVEMSFSQIGTVRLPPSLPEGAPVKAVSNKAGAIGVGVVVVLAAGAGIAKALGWF